MEYCLSRRSVLYNYVRGIKLNYYIKLYVRHTAKLKEIVLYLYKMKKYKVIEDIKEINIINKIYKISKI